MQDWKIRQEVYHRLNQEHEDDLKQFDLEMSDNIVDNALRYFNERDVGWIYPAKSYVVGICYAMWLTRDFNEEFFKVLDDPELLYGNDPYFVPYSADMETYDKILTELGDFDETKGMVPDIRKWYEAEFMM